MTTMKKSNATISGGLSLVCLMAVCSLGVAAQVPQQQGMGVQSGTASMEAGSLVIGAGDLLDVQVFNTPELSGKLRVDSFGKITLPVGGQVDVAGMSVFQAATAIAQKLKSSQVMLNPSVSVNSLEYATQGVTLLGEVKKPGTYPLFGTHSLYDALAAAGGATEDEGSTIRIAHSRGGDAETVEVHGPDFSEVQKTTMVRPGDTIVVSKADMVYVIGDVGKSGPFSMPYGRRLTVLNAVGLAQGTTRTSAMSKAALIRKQGDNGAQTIKFDLDKVMKNKEPNLTMEAGDVLVIPRSAGKTIAYVVLPGVTSAVASAAAFAGIVDR